MENMNLNEQNFIEPPTADYIAPPTEEEKPYSEKNRYTAGILAILLGAFGAHNFYLGFTKKAIIQLVLGLTGILTSVSVVWGVYEGILLFFTDKINVDGKGKEIL